MAILLACLDRRSEGQRSRSVVQIIAKGELAGQPRHVAWCSDFDHELCHTDQGYSKIHCQSTRKTMAPTGGVDQDPQIAQLNEGRRTSSTAGRMFDLSNQGICKPIIEILVLDEPTMLDLGFIQDIRDLIRKLPKEGKRSFFSATINDKIKKSPTSGQTERHSHPALPKDPVAKTSTMRFYLSKWTTSGFSGKSGQRKPGFQDTGVLSEPS